MNTGEGEGVQNSSSVVQNCTKYVQNYGTIFILKFENGGAGGTDLKSAHGKPHNLIFWALWTKNNNNSEKGSSIQENKLRRTSQKIRNGGGAVIKTRIFALNEDMAILGVRPRSFCLLIEPVVQDGKFPSADSTKTIRSDVTGRIVRTAPANSSG